MTALGTVSQLTMVRRTEAGVYLDAGALGEVLLPRRYVPADAGPDKLVEAFVYRDSEDRLVATTERPLACVGGFACMTVRDVVPDVGAFLDWGLSKDLLLPYREQGSPVRIGQRVVVAVCLDGRTDRIIASTRIDRHFGTDMPALKEGQEVAALVWARTDLGWKVIVDGAWRGLLFGDASTAALRVGQTVRAWVRQVREDRKVDLALDPAGYKRVAPLAEQVMAALAAAGGRLEIDDDSPPAAIRARFGASKKAFKQALGALFRERKIEFTKPGIRATK